jgi:hypothetical protein
VHSPTITSSKYRCAIHRDDTQPHSQCHRPSRQRSVERIPAVPAHTRASRPNGPRHPSR